MTAPVLRSVQFRRAREAEWKELERLVGRIERSGLGALTPTEAARLPLLHRAALSALSVARGTTLDRNTLDYLEALAARSHAAIYSGREPRLRFAAKFWLRRFPAATRALKGPVLSALAAMLAGAVVGWVMTAADVGNFYAFVDPQLAHARGPESSTAALRDTLFGGHGSAGFTAFLWTHNSQVAVLCFVAGLAGAIPALLLAFENGLVLGAFAALFASRGLGVEFFGWVLPHGIPELTATVVACGAGVSLGRALLFPGRLRRSAALQAAGARATLLVLGAGGMLAFAAVFEGIFRQEVTDTGVRWTVAAAMAVVWCAYFALLGRGRAAESSA